jgi:hypothetical protein
MREDPCLDRLLTLYSVGVPEVRGYRTGSFSGIRCARASGHRINRSLVWQCYLRDSRWGLYFFEVMTDRQSLGFRPDLYLDIASVRDLKRRALDCHQSQKPGDIWEAHDTMHRRRGAKVAIPFAESFIRADSTRERPKLPLPFLSRKK